MPVFIVLLCVVYVICSLILLAYGLQCYVLTFLFVRTRKSRMEFHREKMKHYSLVPNTEEDAYPLVVTQLPMYNERTVAARVINAVAAIDYPTSRHEIQILDDSTDETRTFVDDAVDVLKKQGVNISVVRRSNRIGYKAGALQNGLDFTKAQFVAIFDSDFVPPKDFLKNAIPFFLDRPKLGLVQGRWTHLNPKASMITRGQATGIDGHFMVEQAARSWNGLFMNFNGTAGIFRRSAIESAGGWQHDTLTEDMDLSYRMQLKGWECEYVPEIEVPAEIPEDINAFKSQQFRWAKGSIQTAIKILPMVLKEKISAFKFMQAFLHLTHYGVHPLMLMMAVLSMPILLFIKVTLTPYIFALVVLAMVLASSGPSTMYMISQHYLGNRSFKKFLLIPAMMLIGTGLAVSNGKAVFEALFKRESPFHRTPKKGESKKNSYKALKDLTPIFEILLGIYCMLSVYMFIGYTSYIVSPFLMLYAAGFLFVGTLSIIHLTNPDVIDIPAKKVMLKLGLMRT